MVPGIVTRQRVTEQTFCGCVMCVNSIIADQGFRVDPVASFIDESSGFYFWKKVNDGCDGMHGRVVVWLCGMG